MKPSGTLLTGMVIFLFSLASLQGLRLLSTNDPKVLGETTTQQAVLPSPQPVAGGIPCTIINNWQRQYCSGVSLPTPLPSYRPTEPPKPTTLPPTYTSHLETTSNVCLADGNISSIIKGTAAIMSSNSGFWMTITDNTTHNMIIRGWQSSGGYSTPVNDNPSDTVWDTKKMPTFTIPLLGDGRTFTYSIYEGAYNSSAPNFDSLKLLAKTTFGGLICRARTDSTGTPIPAAGRPQN